MNPKYGFFHTRRNGIYMAKSFWATCVITKNVSTQSIHPILISNSVSDCSPSTLISLSKAGNSVLDSKLQLDKKHRRMNIIEVVSA